MLISLNFHNFASAPIAFSYASRIVFERALSQIWVDIYAAPLNPHLRLFTISDTGRNYCLSSSVLDSVAIGELQSRLSVRKHMNISHVFLCWIMKRSCKEWLKRRSWRLTETMVRLDRRTDRQSRQTKYNKLGYLVLQFVLSINIRLTLVYKFFL